MLLFIVAMLEARDEERLEFLLEDSPAGASWLTRIRHGNSLRKAS